MKTQRIVQVMSLGEFVQEIPTPLHIAGEDRPNTVRFSLIEYHDSYKSGAISVPCLRVDISLQGINPTGEIVWLMWGFTLNFPGDEFMDRKGHALYKLLPEMQTRITAWLEQQGYHVTGGRYALPKSISPIRGVFECVCIVQDGDGYHVEDSTAC